MSVFFDWFKTFTFYERHRPTGESAKKIADVLNVTLDYLVDEDALPTFDKKTVTRLKEVQQLEDENKSHVFAMLNAFLLKCSIQNNLSTK